MQTYHPVQLDYTIPKLIRELKRRTAGVFGAIYYTIPKLIRELKQVCAVSSAHTYYTIPKLIRELKPAQLHQVSNCDYTIPKLIRERIVTCLSPQSAYRVISFNANGSKKRCGTAGLCGVVSDVRKFCRYAIINTNM